MRWIIILVVLLGVSIATALVSGVLREPVSAEGMRIGGAQFRVLVADDTAERARGLSGMPSLADDTAMLFVFPVDGRHGIWMKDMRFAIDILWLDGDGIVVHIQENATPDSFPRIFTPDENARYVIEMNAGVVGRAGISIGHAVRLEGER